MMPDSLPQTRWRLTALGLRRHVAWAETQDGVVNSLSGCLHSEPLRLGLPPIIHNILPIGGRGKSRGDLMTQFTVEEQDGMEVLLPAAVALRRALVIAARAGVRLQVKHPNVQRPTHMDVLTTTPMRVGVDGLWVDIETEPE